MRSSITFVVSEGLFELFYDGQHELESNFEFDIIHVLKFDANNLIHDRRI
jgi:hypothetical protein